MHHQTTKKQNIMNATAEQIATATEKANKVVSMGCKLSFERIMEIELKKVLKSGWQPMSKKDISKMESRDRVEQMELPKGFDFATKMKENAIKNLPSSLR